MPSRSRLKDLLTPVGAVALAIVAFGLSYAKHLRNDGRTMPPECEYLYANARTFSDTLVVDSFVIRRSRPGGTPCREFRGR